MTETRAIYDVARGTHLQRCPFCGGVVETLQRHEGQYVETLLRCSECHCGTPWKPTKADAVEVWNRRTGVWNG